MNVKLNVSMKHINNNDAINKITNPNYAAELNFEVNDVPEYLAECLNKYLGDNYHLLDMNYDDLRNLAYTKATFKVIDDNGFIYTITDTYEYQSKPMDFSYIADLIN